MCLTFKCNTFYSGGAFPRTPHEGRGFAVSLSPFYPRPVCTPENWIWTRNICFYVRNPIFESTVKICMFETRFMKAQTFFPIWHVKIQLGLLHWILSQITLTYIENDHAFLKLHYHLNIVPYGLPYSAFIKVCVGRPGCHWFFYF